MTTPGTAPRPERRPALRDFLAARGIETRPHYETAVPDLRGFEGIVASAERSRRLAAGAALSTRARAAMSGPRRGHPSCALAAPRYTVVPARERPESLLKA